jgi:hypothetical protein
MRKRVSIIRGSQVASRYSNERFPASKELRGAILVDLSNRCPSAFMEEAENKYRLFKTGETAIR